MMGAVSRFRNLLLVLFAGLLLLTFLFAKTLTVYYGEHERFVSRVRRLRELNAILNQDILKSRYALLAHYDPLVAELVEIKTIQSQLQDIPAFISRNGQTEIRRAVGKYTEILSKKEHFVETLKSQNAVLKNSLDYLPIAVSELANVAVSKGNDPQLADNLNELLRRVLLYNLTANEELAPRINVQIERLLKRESGFSQSVNRSDIEIVVAHAETILKYKPRVDTVTAALASLPTAQIVNDIDVLYNRHREQALRTANVYRVSLYVISVSLLGGIVWTVIKWKNAAASKERIESELRIAHDIQMGILHKKFPPFPDRSEFDIYAKTEPAEEVGGDFYDFFLIGDDQLCFVIGDVSGKGVPAALFMAMTKTLIQATAKTCASPDQILTTVNRELSRDNDLFMMVTVLCGVLNTRTGEIIYSNGGHHSPYLFHIDGSMERLEPVGGPVLGVIEDVRYQARSITLRAGDALFLYTDGVTEAMNEDEVLFSDDRLSEFLRRADRSALADLAAGLLTEVRRFTARAPQSDDITVLALRYLTEATRTKDPARQITCSDAAPSA